MDNLEGVDYELEQMENEMSEAVPFDVPGEINEGWSPRVKELVNALKAIHEQVAPEASYISLPEWQVLGAIEEVSMGTLLRPSTGQAFEADATLYHNGHIVGGASGLARSGETINGHTLGMVGLAGLAQTRAASRAFANRYRFIAVLAGFKQTPAEEMQDSHMESGPAPQTPSPANASGAAPAASFSPAPAPAFASADVLQRLCDFMRDREATRDDWKAITQSQMPNGKWSWCASAEEARKRIDKIKSNGKNWEWLVNKWYQDAQKYFQSRR